MFFQGTASVVLAGLIASQKLLGGTLADHKFLFLGAGEVNYFILHYRFSIHVFYFQRNTKKCTFLPVAISNFHKLILSGTTCLHDNCFKDWGPSLYLILLCI